MRIIALFSGLMLFCSVVFAQTLKTQTDSVSYSLGIMIAQNLKSQGITELNAGLLVQALQDGMAGKTPLITQQDASKCFNTFSSAQRAKQGEATKMECQKFLDANAKRPGVVTTASGLQYEVMKEGEGVSPKPTDKVTVHYHGTLIDGTVFDSSVQRGQPATFPVNGVIAGWVEALQLMKVGSKYKLFIPYNLAYGERGSGPTIKPYAALVFEVELLGINQDQK